MTSVGHTTSDVPVSTEQPATTVAVVKVLCVEASAENTEAMRALLSSLQTGAIPTSAMLSEAGLRGMELTGGTDTIVEDIRSVVEGQRRPGCKGAAAAPPASGDEAGRLTFFAVSRAGTTHVRAAADHNDTKEGDGDDGEEDPLVPVSDALTLGEMLACPQIVATGVVESDAVVRSAAAAAAAAPTLLLFYATGSRWGGHCCCCGGIIAAILAIFCCCCRSRSRPRSPRRPRSGSANPLGGRNGNTSSSNSSTTECYYPNQPGMNCGGNNNNNGYYPAYSGGNVAAVPQAQPYYAPPPVYGGSSNDQGAYYKPV